MPDELPILLFATPAELEAWLEESHSKSRGLWLKIAKKGTEPETRERRLRKFVAAVARSGDHL